MILIFENHIICYLFFINFNTKILKHIPYALPLEFRFKNFGSTTYRKINFTM